MSLQPCGHPSPARCVSLCLSVRVCSRLLHAPAERGKTPTRRPMLSTQLWPPGGSIDITKLNASRRTLTHTRHTIDPLRGAHSRCLGLASNYCITQTLAHAIKPACRVFWTTSIASCHSFANLLITCMHPRTFLRARK